MVIKKPEDLFPPAFYFFNANVKEISSKDLFADIRKIIQFTIQLNSML